MPVYIYLQANIQPKTQPLKDPNLVNQGFHTMQNLADQVLILQWSMFWVIVYNIKRVKWYTESLVIHVIHSVNTCFIYFPV